MFLNNYQYPEKREAFKIFLLFLVSILIRIPVVLLFGDINLMINIMNNKNQKNNV